MGSHQSKKRTLFVDASETDEEGKTALFYAVKQNNESVVRALIDAGADVRKTDKEGKTALFYAVQQRNNQDVVRALIDAGADVNMTDEEGKTALFYAVQQNNNKNVVRALIYAGADVKMTDKEGKTALFYAVQQNNNGNVVRALIYACADVNMSDKEGKTALLYAVQQSNNENVLRALIDAGADVNMSDKEGKTALFYAVHQSNKESVVRALTDAGADVNMTDKEGKTALFSAVQQSDNENVVRALIGSVSIMDIYGRTAHFYVEDPSLLDCLLEAGGNQYLKLKDNCNVDIVSFLFEKFVSRRTAKSLSRFMRAIMTVLEKHGMTHETIAKAIVNALFIQSIRSYNRKYNYSQAQIEKYRILGQLYDDCFEHKILERKETMENMLKALESDVPNITEVLDLLLNLNADQDIADSDGNTVLHHVTRLPLLGVPHERVMDLCNHLQQFGIRLNKRNHQLQTPLLFSLSADLHQEREEDLSSEVKTLVEVCVFLVKQGSIVDETSKSGQSVFHLIIKFFKRCFEAKDEAIRMDVLQEAMKLLQLFPSWKVREGKTINKVDLNQNSPLHLWACMSLLSSQDYTKDDLGEEFTFKAIMEKILKYVLECGARVNALNENDETPLHLCKTWTAVKLLIGAGANPKHLDSTGSSPLLVAAKAKAFDGNPDHFYPDVTEDPKVFWKTAVGMGLDPWTLDKNDESVLGILVKSQKFVLSKPLVDVACEDGYTRNDEVAVSLLNAICKDGSTQSRWKAGFVHDILKSRKHLITASTPLRHCCINILKTGVFEKTKPERPRTKELDVDETPVTEGETEGKQLRTTSAVNSSVHCEIAILLRSYGADIESPDSSGKSCLDVAEGHPALKDFLTKPINNETVPIVIPWTSRSTKYEDKLAKVARRQQCKMVLQFWRNKDPIGKGSFGLIFAGINEKDGREVAIKRIEKLRMQRQEDKREIENLTRLADCEQVVRYISFFEEGDFSYVVLELMEGNLEEYLKGSTIDTTQATLLCKDVVMGLGFLHEYKILHRDLKPQNILYKVHPRVCLKIADFGLSRVIDSACVATTVYGTIAGTRCWMAPELLTSKTNKVDKNRFDPASDMFSCGLLLHYILSGQKHPFNPTDCAMKSELQVENETVANIMKGVMEGWDDSLSPEATHLLKKMLAMNEKERPSAEEALKHALFWTNEKKVDLLKAVGNQRDFECPRPMRTPPLTPVETDLENSFGAIVRHGSWNDGRYLHMPDIYKEMTTGPKGRKKYDTSSAVALVRFIRNVYEHFKEKPFVFGTVTIEQLLFEDFVFLGYFPDLVMEVYKAVTTHGWDKTREDIKSAMKNK